MTKNQLISRVNDTFGSIPRPEMFIRGTCLCEECLEHEAEIQAFTPDNLPLEKLDNPGWDPICFASNAAFSYFMPGLVKLAIDYTADYVEQFIFHIEQPERLDGFTPDQAQALTFVLDYLLLNESRVLEDNLAVDDLFRVRDKLLTILTAI